MVRVVIIFLLTFAMLLNSFPSAIIISSFNLNSDYYKNERCENKSRPELKCEGKCQLKKELEQESQSQKEPVNSSKSELKLNLFLNESMIPGALFHTSTTVFYYEYESPLIKGVMSAIFRPPAFV
jgi:hypothetical protein